jgi:E3 ubiquitin-protein ligase TRIP12
MFTVVCKPSEPPYTSDDYSTVQILREKLTTAFQEGQGAFHLS